jgi:hypothetical protein
MNSMIDWAYLQTTSVANYGWYLRIERMTVMHWKLLVQEPEICESRVATSSGDNGGVCGRASYSKKVIGLTGSCIVRLIF